VFTNKGDPAGAPSVALVNSVAKSGSWQKALKKAQGLGVCSL
jgi:hypothetical protein